MSHSTDGHGHEHPSFLAHHFDDPQQQFDSGKLGIWLFLVTEVLFFSGMFCAYALYRARNPDVYTFASQFLNTSLGAFNTAVLLFSSLTMAWGVRCAQLRQRGGLVVCLAITLCCASMFLGVKAVEYSHKWDMGLLPANYYQSQYLQTHESHAWEPIKAITGQAHMDWLTALCIVPGLTLVGLVIWTAQTLISGKRRLKEISISLLLTGLAYFAGVGIGRAFEDAAAKSHASHEAHSTDHSHSEGHESHSEGHDAHSPEANPSTSSKGIAEGGSHLVSTDGAVPAAESTPSEVTVPAKTVDAKTEMIDQKGGAGLFFSIYYCMTGVHAIHIIGGMVVLTWLLVRASRDEFHDQYFGPVDYVGLYWHLVDLIWIYLFPLLYLIR